MKTANNQPNEHSENIDAQEAKKEITDSELPKKNLNDEQVKQWRAKFQQLNLKDITTQTFDLTPSSTFNTISPVWSQKTISKTFESNKQYFFYKLSPEVILYGRLGSREVKSIDVFTYLQKKSTGTEILNFTLSEGLENNILIIFLSNLDLLIFSINSRDNTLIKANIKITLKCIPTQFIWKNNTVYFNAHDELQFLMFDQNVFKINTPLSAEDYRKYIKYDVKLNVGGKIDLFDVSKIYSLFSIVSSDIVYVFDALGVMLFTYQPILSMDEKIVDVRNFRRRLDESATISIDPDNSFRNWDMVITITSKNRLFIHDISLMEKSDKNEQKSRIAALDLESLLLFPRNQAIINMIEVSEDNSKILFVSPNFQSIFVMEINKSYHVPDPHIAENKMIIPFSDRYECLLLPENSVLIHCRMSCYKNQFLLNEIASKSINGHDSQKQHVMMFLINREGKVIEALFHSNKFAKTIEKRSIKKKSSDQFFDGFIAKKEENVRKESISEVESNTVKNMTKPSSVVETKNKKFDPFSILLNNPIILPKSVSAEEKGLNDIPTRTIGNSNENTTEKTQNNKLEELFAKESNNENVNNTTNELSHKKVSGMFYLDHIEDNLRDCEKQDKNEAINDNSLKKPIINDLDRLQGLIISKNQKNAKNDAKKPNLSIKTPDQSLKSMPTSIQNVETKQTIEDSNIVKLNLINCDMKLVTKAHLNKEKDIEKVQKPTIQYQTTKSGDLIAVNSTDDVKEQMVLKKDVVKVENKEKSPENNRKNEETGNEFQDSMVKLISTFHSKFNSKLKKEYNEQKKALSDDLQNNLQSNSKIVQKNTNDETSKLLEKTFLSFVQKLISKNFESFSNQIDQNQRSFKERIEAKAISRKIAMDTLSKTITLQNESMEEVNKSLKTSIGQAENLKNQLENQEPLSQMDHLLKVIEDIQKSQCDLNTQMLEFNERLDKSKGDDRMGRQFQKMTEHGDGNMVNLNPQFQFVDQNSSQHYSNYGQSLQSMPSSMNQFGGQVSNKIQNYDIQNQNMLQSVPQYGFPMPYGYPVPMNYNTPVNMYPNSQFQQGFVNQPFGQFANNQPAMMQYNIANMNDPRIMRKN